MMQPTRVPRRPRRSLRLLAVGVMLLSVVAAACVPDPPPNPEPCDVVATSGAADVTIMGPCSRLSVDQIVAWFDSVPKASGWSYKASVPLRDLVAYYLDEGNAEGVRGDIAFAQSIIETGYFSSTLTQTNNNFAGIGACDIPSACTVANFRDARTGVRAQIQHLRAYADPTVTVANLHNPLVDPRFDAVSPKGKARTWLALGGTWASDTTYGYKIVGQAGDIYKGVYTRMLEKYGMPLG